MPGFYTGAGDSGYTGTISSRKVRKNDALMEAIGSTDELNSAIGVAVSELTDPHLTEMLKVLQNKLFIIGAELASAGADASKPKKEMTKGDIKELEEGIEELAAQLPKLTKFVLPGGCEGAAHLHMARAIARRAERALVELDSASKISPVLLSFMNRVSSFLFVCALYINKKEGVDELNPTY
jgi:cob(I)alamin adenosyltransferase